jgi:hypothetical protein
MAKLAVIISKNEYVRNYLDSGAFKELFGNHHLTLFTSSEIEINSAQMLGFNEVEHLPTLRNLEVGQLIFDLHMLRYKSRSSSFKERIKRKFPNTVWQIRYLRTNQYWKNVLEYSSQSKQQQLTHVVRNAKSNFMQHRINQVEALLKLGKLFLKGKVKKFTYFMLASRLFFKVSVKVLKFKTKSDSHALNIFQNFNLVVIPSSAYEYQTSLILANAKKSNTKSLLLVDNWDNLSSKSILWEKPDLLACWGDQSKKHAIEIQGMPENAVVTIGTPRIDQYFFCRMNKFVNRYGISYILFLGSSLPYDEVGFLKKIDLEI